MFDRDREIAVEKIMYDDVRRGLQEQYSYIIKYASPRYLIHDGKMTTIYDPETTKILDKIEQDLIERTSKL